LLSGGLDSTVSAAIAKKKTRPLFALTFDYGQRAARMEILASRKISRKLNITHRTIKIPFFRTFKNLALLRTKKTPRMQNFNRIRDVWVPNRNGLFINIAACYAEYHNAGVIITGFNREEAEEFPDNTPQFIAAINHSLMFSTRKKVKVISYVSDYTKKQIYMLGLRYKAPLEHVYSCYLGRATMCGTCASCKRLQQSMR
jgi:7-cyano-7-deazaguanine synthase